MSKLRTAQGDDHPEAAGKHLADAEALLAAGRTDGAAYLSGYVVECSLKSLWLHQTGVPAGKMPWKSGAKGHDLNDLSAEVATLASVANAKIARYVKPPVLGLPNSAICQWASELRYRAPGIAPAQAQDWVEIAQKVYFSTIAEMWQDGVL